MNLEKEFEVIYDWLDDLLSDEEKKKMLSHDVEELYIYHFGLGTWIRNNILTEKSEVYKFFIKMGVSHKDDMSMEIIEGFYGYLLHKSLE